jgi:hypothetical protein
MSRTPDLAGCQRGCGDREGCACKAAEVELGARPPRGVDDRPAGGQPKNGDGRVRTEPDAAALAPDVGLRREEQLRQRPRGGGGPCAGPKLTPKARPSTLSAATRAGSDAVAVSWSLRRRSSPADVNGPIRRRQSSASKIVAFHAKRMSARMLKLGRIVISAEGGVDTPSARPPPVCLGASGPPGAVRLFTLSNSSSRPSCMG